MAPQRTSKKPGDLTRQESKKSRKQGDDESEEMNDVDDAEAMDIDNDPHDDEPEETQSTSAQELLSSMVAGARKRHTANKKTILSSYARTASIVSHSIITLFNEHEEHSRLAHEAQLKRLRELLAYKAKLEAAMEAKLALLQGSYDAHSRDLETVLARRIKEMK